MQVHTIRLLPGQDLKNELENFVKNQRIQAGFVLTCVGSLTQATLRLANKAEGNKYQGYFEIVSLVGTLSADGLHLHASVADPDGQTLGGHLLSGCEIHTTAEVVIGALPDVVYQRQPDPVSGYNELNVYRKQRK